MRNRRKIKNLPPHPTQRDDAELWFDYAMHCLLTELEEAGHGTAAEYYRKEYVEARGRFYVAGTNTSFLWVYQPEDPARETTHHILELVDLVCSHATAWWPSLLTPLVLQVLDNHNEGNQMSSNPDGVNGKKNRATGKKPTKGKKLQQAPAYLHLTAL